MHISDNINGILKENFPQNFSDEFLKRSDLYDILKDIQSIIINNWEVLEINGFESFWIEDKKFLNLIFSWWFTQLEVLKKIENYTSDQEKIINNDNNKILKSIIWFCNKWLNYTISSLWWVLNDSENHEWIKLRDWSSEDLYIVNNLNNLINYFWEKFLIINNIIIKKDEEIIDLTSKNNYLEWENFLSDKEKKSLKNKIFSQNKKILDLKNSKKKIKKSRKNILKEKKNLEEEIKNLESKKNFFWKLNIFKTRKINSLKKELEMKNNLIRKKDLVIKELNLTIKENNDKLSSFQKKVEELNNSKSELIARLWNSDQEVMEKDKELILEYEKNFKTNTVNDIQLDMIDKSEEEVWNLKFLVKDLEEENAELEINLSKTEEQLWMVYKMIEKIAEEKKEKEKRLNENVNRVQSLKDKMRNKLKK